MQPTHTPPAFPDLLTTAEAARLIGTTRDTLQTWRCTHKVRVPYVKIVHLVRYRRSDLEAFISQNVIGAEG